MQTYLQQMKPGMRFRLVGMPEVTGELLSCSDCSAVVRIEGGTREVEFENDDGTTRRFRARRATTTTWASATVVKPIFTPEDNASSQNEEFEMATKKTTKAKAPKAEATTKAKKAKVPKEPKDKKMSAIDAAAQVLASSKEPLNAKEMIEAMAAKGLWTSPGGKTPHATLYSALIREIALKGKEARFVKTERGKFAAK
jgi:hypothetical protein